MSKPKRKAAKAESAPPAPTERPRTGGSFIRDRATGELTRQVQEQPVEAGTVDVTAADGGTEVTDSQTKSPGQGEQEA